MFILLTVAALWHLTSVGFYGAWLWTRGRGEHSFHSIWIRKGKQTTSRRCCSFTINSQRCICGIYLGTQHYPTTYLIRAFLFAVLCNPLCLYFAWTCCKNKRSFDLWHVLYYYYYYNNYGRIETLSSKLFCFWYCILCGYNLQTLTYRYTIIHS